MFFASLKSKKILVDADLDILNSNLTEHGKNAKLYDIVQTRRSYFLPLIFALHETGQTGACDILFEGAVHHKLVNFQATDIILTKILSHFGLEHFKSAGELQYDFVKKDIPVLVNNKIPQIPKYYIKRVISKNRQISSEVFQIPGEDVFILIGLQRFELTKLANRKETEVSSNQTKKVTVQFILLEHDSHFDKISKITGKPVHLIEYQKSDNHFNWVKSNGSVDKIRTFVLQENVYMKEDEFINECLRSIRPVIIADSPGMGKSLLLGTMAQNVLDKNPLHLVRFLQLKDVIMKFTEQPVTTDSLCNAIAEGSSDYDIGRRLVVTALRSKDKTCYLFLDGFDEVSLDQVKIVGEIFKCASNNLKHIRIYAATRLHMKQELENMIGGLGFNMLPFRENEQIEFLVKFWGEGTGGSTRRLHEFASVCLESLRTVIGDQAIAGIPLVCSIIAKIYQDDAKEYSSDGSSKPKLSHTITSIFEMYQVFINDGFSKLKGIQDSMNKIKDYHIKLGVEELFIQWKGVLVPFHRNNCDNLRSSLFLPGVLEPENNNSFRFVHRTFAEYLVAEFISEENAVSDGTTKDPANRYRRMNSKNKLKLLFEDVLATRQNADSVHLRIGGEVQLTSHDFKQPTICYFLNAFLQLNNSSTKLQPTEYRQNFVQMYTAAVVSDKPAIGNFLARLFESECVNLPWSELFLLCTKYSGMDMTKQLTELLYETTEKLPADLNYPESERVIITPLHVAAQTGEYTMFEYLWNIGGFREKFIEENQKTRYLVHECVSGSSSETPEVVHSKLQIISLILSDSDARELKTIVEEKLPHDDSTPLLQHNIQVDLLDCLINNGAELTLNNRRENALHIAAINGNIPLVEFLVSGHSGLVNMQDDRGNTPLHLAMIKRTDQHVRIQLKLVEGGADMISSNQKGCNPFVNGMKHGKGLALSVVQAIENKHAQFLSGFWGLGLKSLLTNSNIMVWDWDDELFAVADYFIRKGAQVQCRNNESPWGLEQVGSNEHQIIKNVKFTDGVLRRLKEFGILNKSEILRSLNSFKDLKNKANVDDKQAELFPRTKAVQGSYEKLMLSLVMDGQMKPFQIMKQCLQADDNESVWFLTPPPGLSDFILNQETKVIILKSDNSAYTATRIHNTVYPDVDVQELGEQAKERDSEVEVAVVFCPSVTKLYKILPQFLSFGKKTVCIVNEVVTLSQLDQNQIKLVSTAYDEVKLGDLSEFLKADLILNDQTEKCKIMWKKMVHGTRKTHGGTNDWQNDVIRNNLPDLIQNTKCNIHLMVILQSMGILSRSDIEELEDVNRDLEKSYKLYEIVRQRNALIPLLEALEKTNQSGACAILRKSMELQQNSSHF